MITPITRKELYLAKIIGEDVDIPETAKTREELFFLKILDNFSKIPEPITREELFLAKISGQDVELPEPKTRLELFLAKAAGVEIETPTPITREEIFWSNYSAIIDFEVEGIPPLTYKAVKGTLKNYRIYGNIVGGAGVGDLETTGEHAGEYKVPVTVSNGADTQTIPIYLTEQIKKVGDETEYMDYAMQKWHRVRKNLLQNTATSQTVNGVTFTVNEDGSVTCNGSPITVAVLYVNNNIKLPEGTYILNGSPQGGQWQKNFKLDLCTVDDKWYSDVGDGTEFNITNFILKFVRIVIYPDYTCNNLTFYPMIRKADIKDNTYEPYITNTELDVTLPALPVLSGTNTLTVGTEVQPSKVYIKGQKERD